MSSAAPVRKKLQEDYPVQEESEPNPSAGSEYAEDSELYEESSGDDAVIGRALRQSLLVICALGLVALLAWLFLRGGDEQQATENLQAEAPVAVVKAQAPPLPFSDQTEAAGIDFVHYNGGYGDKLLPETMGGGVTFFDLEGDGDPDLLLVNSTDWPFAPEPGDAAATSALYRNDGAGRFTDVSAEAGLDLELYGMGATAADYDGDGDADLFFTAVGRNRLLRNDGGRFTDVTAAAGVAGEDETWSTGATFFDAEGDGDLDLFVVNYVRWSREIDFELDFRLTGVGRAFGPPQSYQGTFPYLYRNEGDGTFQDISEEAGVRVTNPATGVPVAKSLGVVAVDLDGDQLQDLVVANDTVRNFLYHNQGEGRFAEEGELWGVAYDRNGNATGAMGIDVAPHRNDNDLGIAVGNFANEMSSMYVSQGDPRFYVDESITEGLGAPSRRVLTFGLFFFDVDLDGRLDLLQANGHVESEIATVDPSQSYQQAGQLFWNGGSEQGLVPVQADQLGDLATPMVGRGAAFADVDGDGDLDVVLAQTGAPARLLRNDQSTGNHWLRVRLKGRSPNTDALGAWVEVVTEDQTQRRPIMPVRSYLSQVELPLTFGLGSAQQVQSLRVIWPDGSEQVVPVEGVDRELVVEQGPAN